MERSFTGNIISVGNGFAFVDINTLTRNNGPHGLSTKQDIYVSVPGLKVGMKLSFDVEPDSVRRDDSFRAINAVEVVTPELVLAVLDRGTAVAREALGGTMVLDRPVATVHPLHMRMKEVPAVTIQMAAQNAPLGRFRPTVVEDEKERVSDDPEQVNEMLERYLGSLYSSMISTGITITLDNANLEAEQKLINDLGETYQTSGMTAMKISLLEQYEGYKATRSLLLWVRDQGFLRPGSVVSPGIIKAYLRLAETVQGVQGRNILGRVAKATDFMRENNLLSPGSILPMDALPELFMAAPVWYRYHGNVSVMLPQPALNAVNHERWRNVAQMFNAASRTM
ncbi:MAG: hypothetical protein NUV56_03515, partial [Candidatus Uhrbacteria bacterium]|nr:hypothetical protein [Candidatus Uhrbacteria bacterium]